MPYQPRATFDNPYGPQVSFRTLDILPPAAYYVGLDDQLVFDVFSDLTNGIFEMAVRILNPQGSIQVETVTLNNNQTGYQNPTGRLTGMEGYLLSVCVKAPDSEPGQSYCRVRLMRSPALTSAVLTALLVAGYASNRFALTYPGTVAREPLDGPARLLTVTASPAAGADWVFTAPYAGRWRILSGYFTLTTSAAATARIVNVETRDAAGTATGLYNPPSTQPASTMYYYGLNPSAAGQSNPPFMNISAPAEIVLEGGDTLRSITSNLDSGDQFSNVALRVEEWLGL